MMLALLSTLIIAQAPEVTLRRFALVAGANDGGSSRVTLRYANSDARAMSKVLTQLGGVDPRDVLVVEDPSPAQLLQALEGLQARLVEAERGPSRVEVFFYYSGHSDEEGLLLKGERLSYTELRSKLDALPAQVRIAVLDSCASGALNLLKGGAPRPSFLVDASSSLSGHAFLTSSSADEAAQESERLKASIFTHFFLSGLRGAADSSHDGRVTLAEAYQYAFAETLTRTTSTSAGPQRPGWDIQLVGTGDLVLTDLRASDAKLVLEAQLGGRVHVLGANGGLVVEVAKAAGKPVELGLEAGDYRVVVDDGAGHVGEAKLTLGPQGAQVLTRALLTSTTIEATVRRGDEPRPHLPVDVAFVPPLSISGGFSRPPRVNFGVGIIGVRVGAVDGLLLGSVGAWSDDTVNGVGIGGALLKTGSVNGVAVGGAVFVATGDVTGLSLSTVTVATQNLVGLHASALSIAGGDVRGAQLSVANIAVGDVRGTQLGVVNFAGRGFGGLQGSVANVAWGEAWGAQVGVLNIGGDVTGAQVGLLNIAKTVRGTQVGLLNIAQTSDAPVGLLNIITRGHLHLAAWTNETSVANVAVKVGGANVYSFLMGGVNPRGANGKVNLSYGLGLGVRARFGRWYGELEGSFEDLHQPGQTWQSSVFSTGARLNVGFQLFERFAVFAGPQLHTHIAINALQDVRTLSPWGFDVSDRVRLVPGVVLGAQFL
ncbi:MAG: caspase family protein [Archangium sp.]|nr:caspase family protein [Archangium sp.]